MAMSDQGYGYEMMGYTLCAGSVRTPGCHSLQLEYPCFEAARQPRKDTGIDTNTRTCALRRCVNIGSLQYNLIQYHWVTF